MAMGGGTVSGPTSVRRAGNQVDVLNAVTSVLAVVALVMVTVVAWVAISSSSPENDALRTLSQSEAVLANETQAVNAAIGRLDTARADGIAHAEEFAASLAEAAGAADDAALAVADKARTDYLAALGALAMPAAIEVYSAPAVGEQSLASIGAAIDAVAIRTGEVAATAETVSDLRTQVQTLGRTFVAAMAAFAATIPPAAAAIVDASPDAEESFREAVLASADAVAATALAAPDSAATLTAYAAAVAALRDDQERAERAIAEERAAREEAERQRQQSTGGGSGTTDPTTPTDPTVPIDPTTPVDPVEPPPTDPGTGDSGQ